MDELHDPMDELKDLMEDLYESLLLKKPKEVTSIANKMKHRMRVIKDSLTDIQSDHKS